ncbi:hypothetical protein MCEET85_00854 [Candidatus Methylopumilus planktonicus]
MYLKSRNLMFNADNKIPKLTVKKKIRVKARGKNKILKVIGWPYHNIKINSIINETKKSIKAGATELIGRINLGK